MPRPRPGAHSGDCSAAATAATTHSETGHVMLILLGRHGNLGRVLIGAAALIAGLVLHLTLLAVAGAVLLAWGGYRLLGSRRAR
jgi:hypothetical protein